MQNSDRDRKRPRDAEDELLYKSLRRSPLLVSCQSIQSPDAAGAEDSPLLFKDDTAIMSKSSLDSTRSLEWLSAQISTPIPLEPGRTTSIDDSPELHRHQHHQAPPHSSTVQHHQNQQPTFRIRQEDAYAASQDNSIQYPIPVYQHSNTLPSPYADYPCVPPPPQQHHYPYNESSAYPAPPFASYYNYAYQPPQQHPVDYSYYHAYYSADLRSYDHRGPSNYLSKPETLHSIEPPSTTTLDPRTTGIPLYLPCDEATLSAYQCMVRQQIEIFAASVNDVEMTMQGRNKKIEPGQVGIRCRHCKHVPVKKRARGAMYYPSKLDCIYQMSQNMSSVHLNKACEHVPRYIRENMELSVTDRKSLAGSGKVYWATGARSLGVIEAEGRLMFADNNTSNTNK